MANITVTNTTVEKFSTVYDATLNAATEDTANTAQKFIITPTVIDNKTLIRVTVANSHGSVTAEVHKGDFWMGVEDLTLECPQNKTSVFELETAKYLQSDGTIEITFTPASGKRLLSDHALKVEVDSLL